MGNNWLPKKQNGEPGGGQQFITVKGAIQWFVAITGGILLRGLAGAPVDAAIALFVALLIVFQCLFAIQRVLDQGTSNRNSALMRITLAGIVLLALCGYGGWSAWSSYNAERQLDAAVAEARIAREERVAAFLKAGANLQERIIRDPNNPSLIVEAKKWQEEATAFVRTEYGPIKAAMLSSLTGLANEVVQPLMASATMKPWPEDMRASYVVIGIIVLRLQQLSNE